MLLLTRQLGGKILNPSEKVPDVHQFDKVSLTQWIVHLFDSVVSYFTVAFLLIFLVSG